MRERLSLFLGEISGHRRNTCHRRSACRRSSSQRRWRHHCSEWWRAVGKKECKYLCIVYYAMIQTIPRQFQLAIGHTDFIAHFAQVIFYNSLGRSHAQGNFLVFHSCVAQETIKLFFGVSCTFGRQPESRLFWLRYASGTQPIANEQASTRRRRPFAGNRPRVPDPPLTQAQPHLTRRETKLPRSRQTARLTYLL